MVEKVCKNCHATFLQFLSTQSRCLQCRVLREQARKKKAKTKAALKWDQTRRLWFKENHQESYTCYLCGKFLYKNQTTLDHVIPRSRAPHLRYEFSNLKPCCWDCNSEKGSKVLEEI